jgi:membrane associated rhomboid family serine protease
VIPIDDEDGPGIGPAFVNVILIGLNVLVFLFQASQSEPALTRLYRQFALIPIDVVEGRRLYTLLTALFLHGGWAHLIGNMLFLRIFGDNIETTWGHLGYLMFYLISGVGASAIHVCFNLDSFVPSLGASGSIAAVLGAYVVLFPQARIRLLVLTEGSRRFTWVTALTFLGLWAILQVLSGVASLASPTLQPSNVAAWAHIGGFGWGLLAGWLLRVGGERQPGA